MNGPDRAGRQRHGAFLAWWLSREWKALLLVGGLAALVLAIGLYAIRLIQRPSQVETGVIVRFGTIHEIEGNSPLVLVRTGDGRVRQLVTHHSAVLGCRRGDSIALVRRGARVTVHPSGCRRQPRDGR